MEKTKDHFEGVFNGIGFKYSESDTEKGIGTLLIKLPNGVNSEHHISGWSTTRVFQYIESMKNLI